MRRTTVRRWKNIGRIAGGSAVIAGNAYVMGKTLGVGRVASTALIPYKATAFVRFATRFPGVVRAGRLATVVHGVGSGVGGMRWGAKLVRRGYQGLRGTVHKFHGNQYVRIPSSSRSSRRYVVRGRSR